MLESKLNNKTQNAKRLLTTCMFFHSSSEEEVSPACPPVPLLVGTPPPPPLLLTVFICCCPVTVASLAGFHWWGYTIVRRPDTLGKRGGDSMPWYDLGVGGR